MAYLRAARRVAHFPVHLQLVVDSDLLFDGGRRSPRARRHPSSQRRQPRCRSPSRVAWILNGFAAISRVRFTAGSMLPLSEAAKDDTVSATPAFIPLSDPLTDRGRRRQGEDEALGTSCPDHARRVGAKSDHE